MFNLFSPSADAPVERLTTALADTLDKRELGQSVGCMQSLWRAVPLPEPWSTSVAPPTLPNAPR